MHMPKIKLSNFQTFKFQKTERAASGAIAFPYKAKQVQIKFI